MYKQPWCSFCLGGVMISEFGMKIPSPFASLELSNSQITSMTSWTLKCVIGGDTSKKVNVAAFEGLLYSAAQAASAYPDASGIPVSFAFGWLNSRGQITQYLSYQGFTLQFKVTTNGLYMTYAISGYASLALQSSSPVIHIPEVHGIVQPSAIMSALCKGIKATSYYELDIDHNDAPTLVSHGAMTTSFNRYVRGTFSGADEYDEFPGLLKLSKSYSGSRDSAGLQPGYRSLNSILNNRIDTPVEKFLKKSLTDVSPQEAAFSYWVDEPTMTQPGVIHYKSNAGLSTAQFNDVLKYGTSDSNILSIAGSYNGIAYNMTDMSFATIGFDVDGSGNTIVQNEELVNSWSSSLADVFQSANIINDVNGLATQFSGDFTIVVPGSVRRYGVAQPISLLVMSGNTVSPVTGIYNIISVSHFISSQFTTTLKIQRLVISSANQVATSQGIYISGSGSYPSGAYDTTSNIITPYKVDFGDMYPTFEDMYIEPSLANTSNSIFSNDVNNYTSEGRVLNNNLLYGGAIERGNYAGYLNEDINYNEPIVLTKPVNSLHKDYTPVEQVGEYSATNVYANQYTEDNFDSYGVFSGLGTP